MSAMLGTHQVINAESKSKREPFRFRYAHSALIFSMHQKRILVTDDADRNFLIPLKLKAEFDAWIEHEFIGNEDRFDNYRLREC